MSKVHIIGSINDDIVATTERHPKPGETVVGSNLKHFPGGKGLNQAVAAARAGADTTMIGLVGDDSAGRQLTEFLKQSGVNMNLIKAVSDVPTGTAIITVAGGENTIVVVAGANGLLDPDNLDKFNPQADDVVVAQYETPIATTSAAFKKAKANSAATILNPAPAAAVSDQLLELTDFLVVNEHEFQLIFDVPPEMDVLVETAAKRKFTGAIIVTLGADGLMALYGGETYRLSGHQVDVVDSTGAGDCFVGYFTAGLATGLTFEKSLERANYAAALSVTKPGAAASIPTLASYT